MEVEQEAEAPLWRKDPPKVLAVLVAHRGSRWLPSVLESLDNLHHQPDAWIAVHDGSAPSTTELLLDHFGPEAVITVDRGRGFGEQVHQALSRRHSADWYWLLHDDAVAAPEALDGLLTIATEDPDIGAAGPKVREWPSLKRLVEVGVTMTGTGHRELGLEPGEPDAGQFDRARDVLAVGSVGMLVRAEAWRALDGFDPNLPLFGDDIDFGWRLNQAGWRVRTAPESVFFHAEASRTSRRDRDGGIVRKRGERRAAALYVMLANEEPRRFPFVAIRLFLGSLLRVLGFLIGKDFTAARNELAAVMSVYGSPLRLHRARSTRAARRDRSAAELRDLRPSFSLPYQHGMDSFRTAFQAVVRPEEAPLTGMRVLGDDTIDMETPLAEEHPRGWLRWPWLTTLLVLTVGALLAARSLWFGNVSSPFLPPPPDTVGAWWSLVLDRSHAVGLGSTQWPSAVAVPLAVLGTIFWFEPGLPIWFLLVFAAPLAAATAHRFGRVLTDDRVPRMIWAVTHGLVVVTCGAVAGGHLGTVMALILLPLIANALWHLVEDPTWTRVMQGALAVAVAAAFAPIMWWIGLAAVVVLIWRWRARWLHLTAVMMVATALLGPTMITRVVAGWRVWWEAGLAVAAEPTAWTVGLGLGGGHGQAPFWFAVPLLMLAVLALVPSETRVAVTGAWLVALLGLVLGLIASLVTFTPYAGAPELPIWTGLPAALWLTGLSTAVLFAAPAARTRRYRRYLRTLLALSLLFPVLSFGWFIARGIDDPLTREAPLAVPAYVAQMDVRSLVLTGDLDDGVVADVVDGSGRILGSEGMQASSERRERLQAVVENLLSNPTTEDAGELSALGVSVIHAPKVDPALERRIDAVPGLTKAGSDSPRSRVWMVDSEVAAELITPASPWRVVVASLWIVIWLAVVIVALPVQHQSTEESS